MKRAGGSDWTPHAGWDDEAEFDVSREFGSCKAKPSGPMQRPVQKYRGLTLYELSSRLRTVDAWAFSNGRDDDD
ncbi:MAG: hypothetical protein AMXMBFR84_44820 [Candidatus Hydrogenedentota bacterium]